MPEFTSGNNPDVSSEDVLKILAGDLTPADIRQRRLREQQHREQNQAMLRFTEYWSKQNTRYVLTMFRRTTLGDSDQPYYAEEVLRAILARRLHVRSKSEGSRYRRERAKRRHGMNKSRNR